MIKALIFDCFDVLYHGSTAHLRQMVPAEHLQELIDLQIAGDRGYIEYDDFVQQAAQLIGITTQELIAIYSREHLRNQPLLEYAASFRPHYKVGLLSNAGKGVVEALFSEDERKKYFDAIVVSSEVDMVKPYPEIFEYMAMQLDLLPSECVMIDDLEKNIDGAKDAGMNGIVYYTQPQLAEELRHLGITNA